MRVIELLTLALIGLSRSSSSQKVALIVDTGMGYNDFEDITKPLTLSLLPYGLNDFTVAASSSIPSYAGFLTGKMQLDNSQRGVVNEDNIHAITSAAKINTGHFGVWPFKKQPSTTNFTISYDPKQIISDARNFIKDKDNYLLTVFMPPLSDLYIINGSPLERGVIPKKNNVCKSKRYGSCDRQLYVALQTAKDKIIGNLLKDLIEDDATVVWSPVHGGISRHTDAKHDPKTSLRGAENSLFDGGIRVRLRYSPGAANLFVRNYANAIDIAPSLLSIFKLKLTETDGGNLYIPGAVSSKSLSFYTDKRAEGDCINTSPAYAMQVTINNQKFKILYDSDPRNDQIYKWNSGFEFEMADINYEYTGSRPNKTLVGCQHLPATGIKNKLTKIPKINRLVFVLLDDVGLDSISYFANSPSGSIYPKTPNIDKLAKENLVFTDAHSYPICTPGRAALFTGVNPSNLGVRAVYPHRGGDKVDIGLPPYVGAPGPKSPKYFFPTYCKDKGWKVGLFGKFHITSPQSGISPTFYGIDPDGYKCHSCNAPEAQTYNMFDRDYPSYSSEMITNDSLAWLDKQRIANKSSCIFITYSAMHGPHRILPGQSSNAGFGYETNPALVNATSIFTKETPNQVYYTLFKFLDDQIGRITDWLAKYKLDDETLLILTSDNGAENEGMCEACVGSARYRGKKRSAYEGGHRVPTILKLGNKQLQGSIDVPTIIDDWFPTVVSLTGGDIRSIPGYNLVTGVDLTPCLTANKISCQRIYDRIIRIEAPWPGRGLDATGVSPRFYVRKGNYTLLADSVGKTTLNKMKFSRLELYDVAKNPLQSNRLNSQQPELMQEYKDMLISWPNFNTKYWPTFLAPHTACTPNSSGLRVNFACN